MCFLQEKDRNIRNVAQTDRNIRNVAQTDGSVTHYTHWGVGLGGQEQGPLLGQRRASRSLSTSPLRAEISGLDSLDMALNGEWDFPLLRDPWLVSCAHAAHARTHAHTHTRTHTW